MEAAPITTYRFMSVEVNAKIDYKIASPHYFLPIGKTTGIKYQVNILKVPKKIITYIYALLQPT